MKLDKKKYPALADIALAGQNFRDANAALLCVEYVWEHEREDYYNWCSEEGYDPEDLNNPHIYTDALKALGLKAEPAEE